MDTMDKPTFGHRVVAVLGITAGVAAGVGTWYALAYVYNHFIKAGA